MSDVLTVAINLVRAVQLIAAAVRGSSSVVVTTRQLTHACKLYDQCLTSLYDTIEYKRRGSALSGNQRSREYKDLQDSLKHIFAQLQLDIVLLNDILQEAQDVEASTKQNKFYVAITNLASGKVDKIKKLESELMTRVQLITTFMTKGLWKVSNGIDKLIDTVQDVDGALFWNGNFGTETTILFREFSSAYSSYLSNTFLFRKLADEQLYTLLRHSLFTESTTSNENLMSTNVTISQFALWLKRYGPMKNTLSKASVMCLPNSCQQVPWFHRSANRDVAQQIVMKNLRERSSEGIKPENTLVVRYSSDPNYQFVVTTKLPTSTSMDNYPIVNTSVGYRLADSNKCHSTLIDLIQQEILDPLFSRPLGVPVLLPRNAIDQWSAILDGVTAELPSKHYNSKSDLDEATQQVMSTLSSSDMKPEASFKSLFHIDLTGNSTDTCDSDMYSSSSATSNSTQKLDDDPGIHNSSGVSFAQITSVKAETKEENADIVGSYMVMHGLIMLESAGSISVEDANIIRDIVNKKIR